MYKIEVIGMRKKHKRILLISIVLLLIAALIGLGIYIIINNETIEISKSIDEEIIKNEVDVQTTINEEVIVSEEVVTNETEKEEFVDNIKNIYNGTEGKRVFLTFDDGPSAEITPKILDILAEHNIKATFFVLGNRVEIYPEIVKRAYDEGHYIANHGYTHKYKNIYKDASSVLKEYNKTENAIREALGNLSYSSNLFRFPGGSKGGPYEDIKAEARNELNENGIAYLDWNALTYDADGAKTKKEIMSNLEETLNGWDNVVLLMHDSADKELTYETLEDVITYLKEEGYSFKNIYDLMED